MKVFIYSEFQSKIEKSGIGRALHHQKRALSLVGIELVQRKEEADVIHINTVFPHSFLLAHWARQHHVPLVYHAHSTKEDFKNSYIGSNLLADNFLAWLKLCYSQGTVIITPTPYSAQLIQSYHIHRPIEVISNGIDLNYYHSLSGDNEVFRQHYGYSKEDKVIMSAGAWIQRKGILDFIHLARLFPQYKFIWFGESSLNAIPKEIRYELKHCPNNLTLAGYVCQDHLRQAYASCDIFLFPSYEETEGIVVLEALAMKIPVLLRDIPVYHPWLENHIHCYKAKSLEEFERIIPLILDNTLPDLTTNGYAIAEERDLKQIGHQLVTVYEKAIQLTNKEVEVS